MPPDGPCDDGVDGALLEFLVNQGDSYENSDERAEDLDIGQPQIDEKRAPGRPGPWWTE